jgi:hypothetical protein
MVGLGINRLLSLVSIARKSVTADIRNGYFWRKADVRKSSTSVRAAKGTLSSVQRWISLAFASRTYPKRSHDGLD